MEESREGEGGIKSQQRITMDNQHSVQPQPLPYKKKKKVSQQIKISGKKLTVAVGVE